MAGAAYRRTMSRRRSGQQLPGRRGPGKGYFIVSTFRPIPTCATSIIQAHDHQVQGWRFRPGRGCRDRRTGGASTDASVAFNGEPRSSSECRRRRKAIRWPGQWGSRLFPELERNLPPSMKMKVAYDSTKVHSIVDRRGRETLGEAVIIVVVVIFLFLLPSARS